jgi:preprotein translocase subunit SecG
MSKWIKKWSDDKNTYNEDELEPNDDIQILKKKMRKIQKKHHNPKNIPIFEDIYKPPQSSTIIEGMEGNDLENTTDSSSKNVDNEEIGKVIEDKIKDTVDIKKIGKNWSNTVHSISASDPIADLENKLSDSLDSLSSFGDIASLGDSFNNLDTNNFANTADNITDNFKIDTKGIKKVIEEITSSMKTLSMVFAGVFKQLAERVRQYKIYIQLYILKINKHIDVMLTNMANALTQNTATVKEIEIFKGQAQQFTTMMLVWYFVYNWYYIIFFLEKEDNVLFTFNADILKKANTYFYGAFGPACRVIEKFDKAILSFGVLKKWLPTPIIMILLFIVFFILVGNNFQSAIITTFFDSMRGQSSTSILSLLSVVIVVYYSLAWFFGSKINGNMEMTSIVSKQQSIFAICFFLVLFILALIVYVMWTVTVNIPLAMFFISSYLAIYTFFGVVFYEGFNAGSIITGITNSIGNVESDFTADGCTPKDVRIGTWVWFKGLFPRLINYLIEIVNFSAINMFEILIFLMLLGGIGLYRKEWASAIEGKVGMGSSEGGIMSANGIQNVFKQLFIWLVIINVLLLIILGIFLYKKFKTMRELTVSSGHVSQSAAADQTSRSLMASKNPNMQSSGTKLNSQALDRIKKVQESGAGEKGEEKGEEEGEEEGKEKGEEEG